MHQSIQSILTSLSCLIQVLELEGVVEEIEMAAANDLEAEKRAEEVRIAVMVTVNVKERMMINIMSDLYLL